jgi:tetratricopeptide (TPR) repeat protein
VADYSHAIELKPRMGWYWHERAYAYLVLGQHAQAIADHSAAIEISDIDSGQRLRRGLSYEALGELEKAEADYARAIELNAADWDNWYRRGCLRTQRGQRDKAQADFARALELKPDLKLELAHFYQNLANELRAKGRHEEAELLYREALEMVSNLRADATNAMSFNQVSWVLVTGGEPTSWDAAVAVELAQKAVAATDRKNPMLLDTLAAACAAAGQFTNAVRVQQEAIALPLDEKQKHDYASRLELYQSGIPYRDHAALARKVSALLAQGKFAEAEPPARQCLTLRGKQIPDDWLTFNARNMLGGSLLGQKKYAEAESLLLAGYEGMMQREDKIPANGKARLKESIQRLIQLYEATDQTEKAAEWSKKLAEFDQPEAENKTAVPKQ